jgi:hypothetical protein
VIRSNDHLTAIGRREWAPSTTSFEPLRAAAKAPLFDRLVGAGEQHRRQVNRRLVLWPKLR